MPLPITCGHRSSGTCRSFLHPQSAPALIHNGHPPLDEGLGHIPHKPGGPHAIVAVQKRERLESVGNHVRAPAPRPSLFQCANAVSLQLGVSR